MSFRLIIPSSPSPPSPHTITMSVTVLSSSSTVIYQNTSTPSSPSPPRTPNTRPPSRSERLLRDTLRRDELALAVPATPTRIQHNRRHSTPTKAADHDRELDINNLTRGSSFLHRSTTTPQRPHRQATVGYGIDTDGGQPHSRPGSPSPSSRRDIHDPSHLPSLTLTPHEQVLRVRLERVLQASRGIALAESHERERGCERDCGRASPQSVSATTSDNSDDASLFRDYSTANTLSSSPTFIHHHRVHDHDHHRTRSRTDPIPLTSPPTSIHRGRSRSHSNTRAPCLSHAHSSQLQLLHRNKQHHDQPEKPLTPPPTPPLPASPFTGLHACLVSSVAHHSASQHSSFNARTASAQCRQIEGYVSFAAIEGLGQPPAGGEDDDPIPDCPGAATDESKGRILGRIWRALGVEAAGR